MKQETRFGYGVYTENNRCVAWFLCEEDANLFQGLLAIWRFKWHATHPVRRVRGFVETSKEPHPNQMPELTQGQKKFIRSLEGHETGCAYIHAEGEGCIIDEAAYIEVCKETYEGDI